MASKRLFSGIAHDIAHHAQSGLSWLHPYVGQRCRESGVAEVEFDLLAERAWPASFPVDEPLRLATAAVRQKFADMISAAGLNKDDLERALLWFRPVSTDGGSTEVRSQLKLKDGRSFAHALRVDWLL